MATAKPTKRGFMTGKRKVIAPARIMFDGDVKGSRFTAKLITKTPKYPYVASKSSNKSPRTYQHDQRQNTTSNIFVLR